MECEVRRGGEGDEDAESQVSVLEERVKEATDQLILTDFPACLDTCRHIIAAVRSAEQCKPYVSDRLDKVLETATVTGIQALAEQGAWRDVIPFVQDVYSHTAASPAAVIKMCLLLHAHMREYMVCHSLLDSWLDWDDHRHHPHSAPIVATYITHVLVPLNAFNLIPQIVERCTALSSEEKQALLSPRVGCSRPSSPPENNTSDSSMDTEHTTATTPDPGLGEEANSSNKPRALKIVTLYLSLAKKVWRCLAKKGLCRQIRRASKLFFLLSFVLLALLHVQTDVTANFTRAMEVWNTAMGTLYSMWTRRPRKHL